VMWSGKWSPCYSKYNTVTWTERQTVTAVTADSRDRQTDRQTERHSTAASDTAGDL